MGALKRGVPRAGFLEDPKVHAVALSEEKGPFLSDTVCTAKITDQTFIISAIDLYTEQMDAAVLEDRLLEVTQKPFLGSSSLSL